jgi:hypothetical protein
VFMLGWSGRDCGPILNTMEKKRPLCPLPQAHTRGAV